MSKHAVYITLDYEIFFGEDQGSLYKTVLYPTNLLREISTRHHVFFTFFIDIGHVIQLEKWSKEFPHLKEEYLLITNQISQLCKEGHDCQLHIHPHWERTYYNGKKWVFDYSFYKLSDFEQEECESIVRKYHHYLKVLTGKRIHSFRAGGWCIQPFDILQNIFDELNITIDSSVYIGGKHVDEHYYYDFTLAPQQDVWRFQHHESIPKSDGKFVELPISEYRYSPWFFWRLYILGNLFPKNHKPIGDGKPMPSSMTRLKRLTQSHLLCGSFDGYFASKLNQVIRIRKRKSFNNTVFIAHPKALTHYSIKKLDAFIANNKSSLFFKTFTEFHNEFSK